MRSRKRVPGRLRVVGRGLADGVVEIKDRRSGERRNVPVADAVEEVAREVRGA